MVCASDSFAIGAWSAIAARGGRPGGNGPRDVAVVGYDDSPPAGVMGLSSVAQPHEQVARWCVRLLHDLLEPGGEGPGDTGDRNRTRRPRSAAVSRFAPVRPAEPHLVVRSSS